MKKTKVVLAGGLIAITAVIALVFGMTAGYGGANSGSQTGADEATAQTISDADLQRMRERGEVLLAKLQAGDASLDGIGVHGAWTLDVLEPNGTLAKHVEFQNELSFPGADWLASLLAGDDTVGTWNVQVLGLPGNIFLCGDQQNPSSCAINDNTGDLTVEVVADANADILRMSGNMIVSQDGALFSVETQQGGPPFVFTKKFLAAEDQAVVVPGQQIMVKVDITFN